MGFALLREKLGGKPRCLEGFLSRIKAFLTRRMGMARVLPQCCLISGTRDSYLGLAVVLLEGQIHDVWENKHIWTFALRAFLGFPNSPLEFFALSEREAFPR